MTTTDLHHPIIQVYEIGFVALLIPFVFIKHIKHLAPFSTLANIASFIGLAVVGKFTTLLPPSRKFDSDMEQFLANFFLEASVLII